MYDYYYCGVPMSSTYPIRAVSRLTGISEDTLRAWERRYKAVSPRRAGSARVYTDKEIERLVLLQQAVAKGHSIGRIATASEAQLRTLIEKSTKLSTGKGVTKTAAAKANGAAAEEAAIFGPLLAAVDSYDYVSAERELAALTAVIPNPRALVHRLGIPLMHIAGQRWHEGTFAIAQEHMITSLLSGLFASMLRLYAQTNPRAKILLATPENEHHGFGILAAAMLAAAGGLGAIHLGTNLPAREIAQASRKTQAHAILIGLSAIKTAAAISALEEIQKKAFPRTKLWVGGASPSITAAANGLGWTVLDDFQTLERHLGLLGARF